MSEETKPETLKSFDKEFLKKQITASEDYIRELNAQIIDINNRLAQQTGILNFSKHLLAKFDIPDGKPEAPPAPPAPTEPAAPKTTPQLEVK